METYSNLEKMQMNNQIIGGNFNNHFELKQNLQKEIVTEVQVLKKSDQAKLVLGKQQFESLNQFL